MENVLKLKFECYWDQKWLMIAFEYLNWFELISFYLSLSYLWKQKNPPLWKEIKNQMSLAPSLSYPVPNPPPHACFFSCYFLYENFWSFSSSTVPYRNVLYRARFSSSFPVQQPPIVFFNCSYDSMFVFHHSILFVFIFFCFFYFFFFFFFIFFFYFCLSSCKCCPSLFLSSQISSIFSFHHYSLLTSFLFFLLFLRSYYFFAPPSSNSFPFPYLIMIDHLYYY